MPDTLNPESLRRAAKSEIVGNAWQQAKATAPLWMCPWCGESVGYLGRAMAAVRGAGFHGCDFSRVDAMLFTATDPLRDAVGDLLHMHRRGDVSAEMWERVAAAFDGAKP